MSSGAGDLQSTPCGNSEALERRREIARRYANSPKGQANRREWRKNNPDKQKAIERRQHARQRETGYWYQRNPDRHKETKAAWLERSPEQKEKKRWAETFRNHGVTKAQFEEMVAAQGGLCAICDLPAPEGTRLHIDHDHETGKIRGLLCTNCNPMIGFAKDNQNILAAAITYLAKWENLD